MNDLQRNPMIEELVQELEEDLTPYVDALARLGASSTAQKVAEDLTRVGVKTE
jgi:hypothetical protein